MDPVTALGVAGTVVQFADFSIKLVKVFSEYAKLKPEDTPKSIESITLRLPILLTALARLKDPEEVKKYDGKTQYILHGVVVGCLKLVQELDIIAHKIRPAAGDGQAAKLKRILISLKKVGRVAEIDQGLQAYAQVLILHNIIDRNEVQSAPVEESNFFLVKEQLVQGATPRDALRAQLDEQFFQASRSLAPSPVYVTLQGVAEAGKTQLALEYCHHAHKAGHFPTIFWLHASTEEKLKLSIEAAASTVQQSRTGTREEKLQFFKSFLQNRWHPWLLVLDDYQPSQFDASLITSLLPGSGHGGVIITSRSAALTVQGSVIKVTRNQKPEDQRDSRATITQAIHAKDLQAMQRVLDTGYDLDYRDTNSITTSGTPVINIAADMGWSEGLKFFLDRGAHPFPTEHMSTALQCAVSSGDLATVTTYLDYESRTGNAMPPQSYNYTFGTAIEHYKSKEILTALLQRHAAFFNTGQQWLVEKLLEAAKRKKLEIFEILLAFNCFPSASRPRSTILCGAIEGDAYDVVKFFLHEFEIDPNQDDRYGEWPLTHVAEQRNTTDSERLKYYDILFKFKADPNVAKMSNNRTALHIAASNGHIESIKLLLRNGADPTLLDEDGRTPLRYAAERKAVSSYPVLTDLTIADEAKHRAYFQKALFEAARRGDRDLALNTLKKVDINAIEAGKTPLIIAIEKSHTALARMLIRNGASQVIPDSADNKPLLLAAHNKLDSIVKELARAKDSPGLEIRNSKGNTALMNAVLANSKETVEMLLSLGADRDANNEFGDTALDIAEEKGLKEIVGLLDSRTTLPLV